MNISPDVMIMTRAELDAAKTRAFQRGVERGRFEQNHENLNTPEAGQAPLARHPAPSRDSERPGDEPVAVGASPAGRFLPEGWTFEDHHNGVVYVRAPSGKHAAIGYLAPGDMVLSGILHELVGAVLTFNAPPST